MAKIEAVKSPVPDSVDITTRIFSVQNGNFRTFFLSVTMLNPLNTTATLVEKLVYATERFFHSCNLQKLSFSLMHSLIFEFCQGFENILPAKWQS